MKNEAVQSLLASVDSSIAQLAAETDAYRQSTEWKRILKTMSVFHTYSFTNQMAILTRRPNAVRVAGFEAWKKLGRHVVKGAKGIPILAPVAYKPRAKAEDSDTAGIGDTSTERTRLFFRTVYVFDQADTEGEPVAELILKSVADDNGKLATIEAAIRAFNIDIVREKLSNPDVYGYATGGKIVLREGLAPGEACGVLVHEAAHELLHFGANKAVGDAMTRAERETEAESTAYAVMQHFGIESTANVYLASYNADGKAIKASLERIRSAVTILISQMEEVGESQATSAAGVEGLPLAA